MNEKETQTQKEEASEDIGGPAKETAELETKQTSDGKKTTSPPDATDELTKIFAIPGRPDLKLTGQEVANAIGRAELAVKFQGDADKATAEKQTALERAVQAEAKLQAMEQDKRVIDQLETAGLLGAKPTASTETTEDWLGEKPTDSQLGAKEVARIVEDTTRQTADTRFEDLDSKITERVKQELQTERDADQQLKEYQTILAADRRTRRATLRQDYPAISDDRLEEIAILQEAAQEAWTDAQKAASEGEREISIQKIQERSAYSRKSNKLEAEAIVAQGAAEKKADYEQQLETGDFVPLPEELSDDEERKPIMNPEEAKKRHGTVKEFVINRILARDRAKIAQGL